MPLSQSTNLEDVDEVLHAIDSGNDSRCRRTEREIRNALQNDTLSHYHRACLTALLGLLTKDWREAEHLRIRTAEAYTRLRSEAAVASSNKLSRIDSALRHTLIARLNAKQEANAPASGLTSAKVPDEFETRRFFRAHGLGHKFAEFKKYPERIVDHKVLRRELEKSAVRSMGEENMDDRLEAILLNMFAHVVGLHDSSDDDDEDQEARVWEIDDEAEKKLQKKKAKNRQRNLCRRNKEKAKKADVAALQQEKEDTVANDTTESASEPDATVTTSADSTAQPKLSKRQKKTLLKKARQAAAESSAPDDADAHNGNSTPVSADAANSHHDSKDKSTPTKKNSKKSNTKDDVE